MINKNYYVVYDYETIGSDAYTTMPVEIAAYIIEPRSLELVKDGYFQSRIKVADEDMHLVQERALQVNGRTREDIQRGPEQGLVMKEFARFLEKYMIAGRKPWRCPIPCGQNIVNFDNIITHRMCEKYKLGEIFHPQCIDTMNLHLLWFENEAEPEKYGMDTLRPWWGMSNDGAHGAKADAANCSKWIIRFLQFHRNVIDKYKPKFKGAFADVQD